MWTDRVAAAAGGNYEGYYCIGVDPSDFSCPAPGCTLTTTMKYCGECIVRARAAARTRNAGGAVNARDLPVADLLPPAGTAGIRGIRVRLLQRLLQHNVPAGLPGRADGVCVSTSAAPPPPTPFQSQHGNTRSALQSFGHGWGGAYESTCGTAAMASEVGCCQTDASTATCSFIDWRTGAVLPNSARLYRSLVHEGGRRGKGIEIEERIEVAKVRWPTWLCEADTPGTGKACARPIQEGAVTLGIFGRRASSTR